MDEADRATELEEADRARAMSFRVSIPAPTGFCLNCGIEVARSQCFCDLDCRDDFEVAASARARNGRQ